MADVENKQKRENREKMLARLKEKYPEQNFDDDEALMGRIYDDYDDYDAKVNKYKADEKTFADMFATDGRSATFLANWRNGSDPAIELVRQFGDDIKDALEDPEKLDKIAEANKEYAERVSKEKELEKQYQQNLKESLRVMEQYQSENGLSDDQLDSVMELLMGIVTDGIMGKFTEDSIDMARKALNYDIDVEMADEEGEVRGKNAKIKENLELRKKGDGVPRLDGGNNKALPNPQRNLGALDKYGDDNDNIFARGGMKRIPSRR